MRAIEERIMGGGKVEEESGKEIGIGSAGVWDS